RLFFCISFACQSTSTLFPYTTLFRSGQLLQFSFNFGETHFESNLRALAQKAIQLRDHGTTGLRPSKMLTLDFVRLGLLLRHLARSEEHTSELQSRFDLVCRLLLEKKN